MLYMYNKTLILLLLVSKIGFEFLKKNVFLLLHYYLPLETKVTLFEKIKSQSFKNALGQV